MTNKLSQTAAVIECVLFLENRTMNTQEISRFSHINEQRVVEAVKELQQVYDENGHGIALVESEEGYQFIPRESLHERLKKTYGKKVDTRLTRAAVETLTIIAYNQPVKKREIDNIRGSNSEDIVKRLRELDYIKVIDRTEEPGHPARYGTTKKFLYDFNLSSIADLPRLDKEESERFEDLNLKRDNNDSTEEEQDIEEIDIELDESDENTNKTDTSDNSGIILIKKSELEAEEDNELDEDEDEEIDEEIEQNEDITELEDELDKDTQDEEIDEIEEQDEEIEEDEEQEDDTTEIEDEILDDENLDDDTPEEDEEINEEEIEEDDVEAEEEEEEVKDEEIEEITQETEDEAENNLQNDKSKLFDSVKKIDKNELQRILDFSDEE